MTIQGAEEAVPPRPGPGGAPGAGRVGAPDRGVPGAGRVPGLWPAPVARPAQVVTLVPCGGRVQAYDCCRVTVGREFVGMTGTAAVVYAAWVRPRLIAWGANR